jgi:hypothetical protein
MFADLENVVNTEQIITCDRIKEGIANNVKAIYYKRDFLFRKGKWRKNEIESLSCILKQKETTCVVVGHSDLTTNKMQSAFFKTQGIKNFYGVNVVPFSDFAEPIPIGVTNDCDDSPIHRILGNPKYFLSANKEDFFEKFNNSIYCNFTLRNNKDRMKVMNELSHCKSVVFKHPEITEAGRISYLMDLRTHNFVICPSGNGIDTHRIWETLYMGGIPIVKSNKVVEKLSKDLPIIVVKKWSQVLNLPYMEEIYYEFTTNRVHNFEKLQIQYWLNKISNKVNS